MEKVYYSFFNINSYPECINLQTIEEYYNQYKIAIFMFDSLIKLVQFIMVNYDPNIRIVKYTFKNDNINENIRVIKILELIDIENLICLI